MRAIEREREVRWNFWERRTCVCWTQTRVQNRWISHHHTKTTAPHRWCCIQNHHKLTLYERRKNFTYKCMCNVDFLWRFLFRQHHQPHHNTFHIKFSSLFLHFCFYFDRPMSYICSSSNNIKNQVKSLIAIKQIDKIHTTKPNKLSNHFTVHSRFTDCGGGKMQTDQQQQQNKITETVFHFFHLFVCSTYFQL